MGIDNRPFFDLGPPVVWVEEDRTARREDRQRFEESLDRYLELKEKLDAKIALGQNIAWDEETEYIRLSNEVLKSVMVISTWQLGVGHEPSTRSVGGGGESGTAERAET
jgi:hypothetical protein